MNEESRKALRQMSFTEKIRILERLRDRSLMIASFGLRRDAKNQNASKPPAKSEQE